MEQNRSMELMDVSDRELKILSQVLNKYNILNFKAQRARSAYKIITDKDIYCLKRMKHGGRKPRNGYALVTELKKKEFKNTASYIKTKDNNYYVKENGFIFYLTEWINGEECSLDSISETVNCVKLLAKFHIASSSIDMSNIIVENNLKNWPKIFISNLHGLENFKKAISRKKLVTEFDSLYMEYIDSLYHRGMVAINILNKSNYYKLSKKAATEKTICHDSFYYQNIIKKHDDYYLIDLDSIIIDLQINDLGKFIRRLMYKKSYKWDFDKAKYIIEAYNDIKPLTKDELEVMLALIVFPHKFWKLGKKRYIKHKHWPESKYMSKLSKIIKYNDLQDLFVDKYIDYLNSITEK